MTKNTSRLSEVREKLHVDTVSVKRGVYTVRRGFFYTHGYTADKFVAVVKHAFPDATVLDSGEVWKPFIGGAPVSRQSHWFVKFTLGENHESVSV